ncbi:MAG TPA: GAF domain-containing protein [Dictyobacter sp.]|jgi:transcriptional regulator with XRE-family HTH domain|nr:GAF domain-containing protein [Dictyobacter sp.]
MITPPPSWSNILQGIIKSTSERQRLAASLGVSGMTLSRWANGESKPQRPHLIHLLQVINANQRQELLEALEEQFPDVQSWLTEDTPEHIPSDFFAQILNIRATTTESLRFWRISEAVLKQALTQLDPNRLGMAVKLVQCMEPSIDGKVRSLRERAGKGNSPWAADLEHDVLFLGMESLSGYAVEVRHIVSNDDLRESKTYPAIQDEFEVSAAAHPIRFEGNIAGCLLASSTQANYFSQQRLNLLATFSDILSLAFDKNDFYPSHIIELRAMPNPSTQRLLLTEFRQRVAAKFQDMLLQKKHYNNATIEKMAWQDLEMELLTRQVPDANNENATLS